MDYGDLLKRGWRITWNNKWLWILGFLAALGGNGGNGGGGNANFSGSGNDFGNMDPETMDQFGEFGRMLESGELWAQIGAIIFVAICCLAIFFIIMWFVRLVAEAGLIQAAVDIEYGEKTSFQKAFSDGSQYIGKLFGVNVVLWLIPAAIAMIIGIIAAAVAVSGGEESAAMILICFVPLACLLIPYAIIVSIIYPIAQRGVVLQKLGVMDSIKHGWQILKAHVGEILLIGLIFIAVGIGFGLVTAAVVLPVALATMGPAGYALFANGFEAVSGSLISLAVFGVFLVMVLGSIINAVMIVFRSSTFTLAYLEFTGKEKAPPVMEEPLL
ncbi:MAG: hypothetical protein KDE51_16160 [Anaerolineales bacterium]|nr:hypothetical protein [Anaerolineales bacterium]